MNHLGVFISGVTVTLIVAASLTLLIWGAILDGREVLGVFGEVPGQRLVQLASPAEGGIGLGELAQVTADLRDAQLSAGHAPSAGSILPHVGGELLEGLLERGARGDGAAGVVLGDLGDAPGGHHPVAHEFGDGPRVLLDGLLEEGVVAGEDLTRDLGVVALAEAGRAAQVREEHGDGLAHGAR